MTIDTLIQILIWTTIITAGGIGYAAVSFGPYLAGKEIGRKRNIKAMIEFSLENPTQFELWLRKQQIELAETQSNKLRASLGNGSPKQEAQTKTQP